MISATLRQSILVAGLLGFRASAGAAQPPSPTAGYMDFAALTAALNEIDASSGLCQLSVIGSSREGRGLHLLTLSSDAAQAGARPALLITAGLDGRHRVGPETAVRVARRLLVDHIDLLNEMTVYIIPCANPDGMERNAGKINFDHVGNMRVLDDDRDGAADEDGPSDLNGDGYITMMRRLDPPLDDKATHLPDPAAPRLLKTPEAEKGERAIYSIYTEGLDADGDGKIAEDGPGQIDLDRNFMHRWPEYERNAGTHQISEPESAALAKFIIERRNIVEAITFGRHDNLINVPDGKGKDVSGQAPKDLDPDDVNWYKELSKVFKEITGQERGAQEDTAGSFHAWLHAQRGVPSLATVVWGRPEVKKEEKKEEKTEEVKEEKKEEGKPEEKKEDQTPSEPNGETESAKPPATADLRQAAEEKKDDKKKKKDEVKPADAEAAAWLEYSDKERGGQGFIEWQPFDHPTLGKVEIGGFVPGFRMNPPTSELDTLAEKHTAFIVELMKRRPKLNAQGPTVKKLASNLYEVRYGVVNEGYLPTATSIARKARSIKPTVVRISVPVEQIVAGNRVNRAWGIGGSGDRFALRWIVRVEDGADITLDIINPHLGNQTITFKAEETK